MYEKRCMKLLYFAFYYYYATLENGHTDIKRLNQKITNSSYDGIYNMRKIFINVLKID